ncbi:cilia- and flagella-associated protein 43 [Grus japonensis]|uniref:Cilia- and flagella-associated protein 43 n=1 Tax=Grus japonensis TaxID=30415 RepID=A0ABC9X312_GRUJA
MEAAEEARGAGLAGEELRAEAPGSRHCPSAEEAALEVSWVQGFPKKNFGFINNQTICYPCGNYILFLDIETKTTTALQCQTGQVGAFAANGNSQVLAFSDRKLNPIIYIYTFPELNKLTELKGNAQLDYTLLAFSFTGPYLASYSSIPEFVLSVCPVKLPDGQRSMRPHKDLFFPVSHSQDPYHGPDLPVSAIAGLPRNYIKPSMNPTAHCWNATSEIYLGCKEGYVLAIDAETCSVSVLQQKPLPEYMRKISDVVSYVRREVQKKKGISMFTSS